MKLNEVILHVRTGRAYAIVSLPYSRELGYGLRPAVLMYDGYHVTPGFNEREVKSLKGFTRTGEIADDSEQRSYCGNDDVA